jgi:hypothetical protein
MHLNDARRVKNCQWVILQRESGVASICSSRSTSANSRHAFVGLPGPKALGNGRAAAVAKKHGRRSNCATDRAQVVLAAIKQREYINMISRFGCLSQVNKEVLSCEDIERERKAALYDCRKPLQFLYRQPKLSVRQIAMQTWISLLVTTSGRWFCLLTQEPN